MFEKAHAKVKDFLQSHDAVRVSNLYDCNGIYVKPIMDNEIEDVSLVFIDKGQPLEWIWWNTKNKINAIRFKIADL